MMRSEMIRALSCAAPPGMSGQSPPVGGDQPPSQPPPGNAASPVSGETSVAGLLIVFSVGGGAAGAAALIQRFLMTGTALVLGLAAYLAIRRPLNLGGIFQVTARRPSPADGRS